MKFKIVSFCALLVLIALSIPSTCGAQGTNDPSGTDDRPGHHAGETNQIEGVEHFSGHVVLERTGIAPKSARGIAELAQDNKQGAVFYKLQVKTFNLEAGTYSAAANLVNNSNIILGDLITTTSRGRGDFVLPAGVTVLDISQVTVSDASTNVVLIGDINSTTPGTTTSFNGNVKLTAGPGAPNGKGKAQIKVAHRHGTTSERFTLIASKLSPRTTYDIVVNGVSVGTVTSKKNGSVAIRSLNADLMGVTDVSLVSAADQVEAVHAHF